MNSTSISTSNFRVQSVIALALTASTLSNTGADYFSSLTIPHYPMQVFQATASAVETTLAHTSTNIGDLSVYNSDFEQYKLIQSIGESLINRSKDLDPKIAKIIDDNFWDLI